MARRGAAAAAAAAAAGPSGPTPRRACLADFTQKQAISKGSFGSVHRVVRRADDRVFALKEVDMKGMNRSEREETLDEARVLARLDSRYVTKYYDCFVENDVLYIIMQYAERGTLHALIHKKHTNGFPEEMVWRYFLGSLLGVGHIHRRNIIHRDVKSLNLFLDADDNVLLGDVGIAKVLSNHSKFAQTIIGTPYYLSPELCEDKPYGTKSDMWALGIVLYELCTGRYPFDAQNEGALIKKILRGTYTPLPSGKFSNAINEVLKALLTKDPKKRASCEEILLHPAVKQRAAQLGIVLDPDAKKITLQRPLAQEQKVPVAEPVPLQELPPANHEETNGRGALVAPSSAQLQLQNEHAGFAAEFYNDLKAANSIKRHQPAQQQQYRPQYHERPPYAANVAQQAPLPNTRDEQPQRPGSARSAARTPQASYGAAGAMIDPYRQEQRMASEQPVVPVEQYAPNTSRDPYAVDPYAAGQQRDSAYGAPGWEQPPAVAAGRAAAPREVGAPFAAGSDGYNPYIEYDMQRMGLAADQKAGSDMVRAANERDQQRAAIAAAARADNMQGLFAGGHADSMPGRRQPAVEPRSGHIGHYGARVNPAAMPAAGAARPQSAGGNNFFGGGAAPEQDIRFDGYRTMAQEQQSAMLHHSYEPPKFGRKRATDLMITGPSMREPGPSRPGSARLSGGNLGQRGGVAMPSGPGSSATTTTATNIFAGPGSRPY